MYGFSPLSPHKILKTKQKQKKTLQSMKISSVIGMEIFNFLKKL